MNYKKLLGVFFLTILSISTLQSQNIFEEKYSNCNTEHFVMENDTVSVLPKNDLRSAITSHLTIENLEILQGFILMQVIVNMEGESCLISIDNQTNISLKKLDLKNIVDSNLKWRIPDKNTATIIKLIFDKGEMKFTRYGLNSTKGFHELELTN